MTTLSQRSSRLSVAALAFVVAVPAGARAQEALPFLNPVILDAISVSVLPPAPTPTDVPSPSATEPEEAAAAPAPAAARGVASFRDLQLEYPRVRRAFDRTSERVDSMFEARGVADPAEVFLRVFKREQVLEVWARDQSSDRFALVETYPVCKSSGELGPKRRQGDRQVPEGFYHIDLFNPWSSYHLSMRVNYPNPVDRARGTARPGGNIFIHGDCVTVGCVPLTDELIEEVYVIAVEARARGQRRIPVHIFPTRLDDEGMTWLRQAYGRHHIHQPFWENLRDGYLLFEERRRVPDVAYDGRRYLFPEGVPATD